MLDDTFEAVAPLPARPTTEAVVGAMSQALHEVLTQLGATLQEVIQ